jgi:phosphohistidine phosphatase
MKTLLLMRHAKTLPAANREPDRDRSLTDRGHRDARLTGIAIRESWLPDLILCSPAVRTVETMDEVVGMLPRRPESITEEKLYHGSRSEYLEAVADHGGKAKVLLLVGHNPTIQEVAVRLAKSPDARMRVKFPTAALAVLEFDGDDWARLKPGTGKLIAFLRPKDLGARDADD